MSTLFPYNYLERCRTTMNVVRIAVRSEVAVDSVAIDEVTVWNEREREEISVLISFYRKFNYGSLSNSACALTSRWNWIFLWNAKLFLRWFLINIADLRGASQNQLTAAVECRCTAKVNALQLQPHANPSCCAAFDGLEVLCLGRVYLRNKLEIFQLKLFHASDTFNVFNLASQLCVSML